MPELRLSSFVDDSGSWLLYDFQATKDLVQTVCRVKFQWHIQSDKHRVSEVLEPQIQQHLQMFYAPRCRQD